jgi:hypothetical protein
MMTRVFSRILVAVVTLLTVYSSTLAMNHSQGKDVKGGADPAARPGENILNATVDGHQFAYYLIDMQKQMAKMQNQSQMTDMKASHHLMVYVTQPDGQVLDQAKVGYLVVGPDGAKQKQMGMKMRDGFGADLQMGEKGPYSVTTKAVADGKTLMHRFTYEMK